MLTLMQTHCMLTRTGSRDYACLNCCAVVAEKDWYEHVHARSWAQQVASVMAGGAYDVRERQSGDAGTLGTRSACRQQHHQRACAKGVWRRYFAVAVRLKPASGRPMKLIIDAHHGAC